MHKIAILKRMFMRKIALKVEAKSVVVPLPYGGGETMATTVISPMQLLQLIAKNHELRWLIPVDEDPANASWWTWPSKDMIHGNMCKALGYSKAMTGYVEPTAYNSEPGHIVVFWYDTFTTQWGDHEEGNVNPTVNKWFKKVLSDPKLTIEYKSPLYDGMTVLTPEHLGITEQPAQTEQPEQGEFQFQPQQEKQPVV